MNIQRMMLSYWDAAEDVIKILKQDGVITDKTTVVELQKIIKDRRERIAAGDIGE